MYIDKKPNTHIQTELMFWFSLVNFISLTNELNHQNEVLTDREYHKLCFFVIFNVIGRIMFPL